MSQKRPHVITTRVSSSGYVAIEKLRVEFGTDFATLARILFTVALNHPREVEAILKAQV